MKLRNVAIAALSVLTLFGGGAAVYGTSQVRAAQQQFVYSGYLLDGSENQENGYAKYTFEAGTTYKTGYPDSVIFKDTAGVQVATSRNAFLHYADGSLSALTDGVIVDLNNMSNGMLNNFGINAGTILERRDSSYVVDSISGTLYLDDFLWKINDSQYILVSSTIDITTGNQAPIYYNDYVEMRYYNEGILMLITENGAYRTVASDCVATVNSGIQLDLSARTVTTDEEGTKMSMEQIVLDSNQVIDVLKPIMSAQKSDDLFSERQMNEAIKVALPTFEVIDGEDGKTGEVGEDGEDGEAGEDGQKGQTGADGLTGKTGENGRTGINGIAGPDGAGGAPGAPGEPGVAGTSGTSGKNGQNGMGGPGGAAGAKGQDGIDGNESIKQENIVEEHEQLVLPEFSFADFKVTENSVSATLEIDSIAILKNNVVVDLLRAADGKPVGSLEHEPTEEWSDIAFTDLIPDTVYLLRVTATYAATDATGTTHDYMNVFLTKQFTTNASGIYVELVVREENALTFRVVKPDYSEVKDYELVLRDANAPADSQQQNFTRSAIGEDEYKFTGLSTNTPYYVDVTQIALPGGTMPNILGEQKFYTLKKKPTLPQPEVFVNKVDSSFEMSLPLVVDPDNGIRYYRYEVYEGTSVNSGVLKKTFQISTNRTVSCPVDDVTIVRARNYVARVVAGFYDNEKTIEYAADSVPFIMQGSKWPSVRFERENVNEHDVLKGNIILSMNDAELDEDSLIRVYYRSSSGKTKEWTASVPSAMTVSGSAIYTIPFKVDGLCANDTYTCDVYGRFTLGDVTEDGGYYRENERMGSFIEKTKPTGTVAVTLTQNDDDTKYYMSFKMNMKQVNKGDADETALNKYAYKSASGLQLDILDSQDNTVYSHTYESKNAYNPDNQTGGLSSELGGEETVTFTENDMPGVMSLLPGNSYKVRISRVYDHTDEENAIKFAAEGQDKDTVATWTFTKNETVPDAEEIERNPFQHINPITNANATRYIEEKVSGLADSAIIGYQLIPNYSNLTGQEKEFVFYVFRCSDKEGYQLQSTESTAENFYVANTGENSVCLRTQSVSVENGVPEIIFWLKDIEPYEDVPQNTIPNKLTRGQKYAFAYEVKMRDGSYFPERSSEYIFLSAKKEEEAAVAPYVSPDEMQFVHWKSGKGGEMQYKYKMKIFEADKAAISTEFSGAVTSQININHAEIQTISKTGLSNSTAVKVNYSVQSYSDAYDRTEKEEYTAINHVYESQYTIGELKVSYDNKSNDNRITITVEGAAGDINRIAGFVLTVKPSTPGLLSRELKVPISAVSTVGDHATITSYVNYSLLDGFERESLTLGLTAMYDNGVSGYGAVAANQPVAIQALQNGKYVKLNASGEYQCNFDSSARDSWFTLSGVGTDWIGTCKVTHVLSEKNVSLPLDPTYGGTKLAAVNSAVTIKQLGSKSVTCDDNTDKNVTINNLTPSVTLTEVETSNAWANVKFVLSGYSSLLKNNIDTLYMEVFKANDSGEITEEKVRDNDFFISISAPDGDSTAPLNASIEIGEGLVHDSTYAVRFYYEATEGRQYPLDTERPGTAGANCYFMFRTKGAITFTEPEISYIATDYDTKKIAIKVKINDNRGYDIVYKLKDGNMVYSAEKLSQKGILSKTHSVDITGSKEHTIMMEAVFGIDWFGRNQDPNNPADDLILYATPVSSQDNTKPLSQDGEPIAIPIMISELPKPSFDVLPIPSREKITVRMKAMDPGRMIYGDKFKVRILDKDKNDVTPVSIADTEYSPLSTQKVEIRRVKYNGEETDLTAIPPENRGWYVKIEANLDTSHKGSMDATPAPHYSSMVGLINLSDTDSFLGEVELVSIGQYLALDFVDSVDLTNIADKLVYTEYKTDSDNGYYKPYTVNQFNIAVEKLENSTTYRLKLDQNLAKAVGRYRIEFEFFKNSNSVTRLVFTYTRVLASDQN